MTRPGAPEAVYRWREPLRKRRGLPFVRFGKVTRNWLKEFSLKAPRLVQHRVGSADLGLGASDYVIMSFCLWGWGLSVPRLKTENPA